MAQGRSPRATHSTAIAVRLVAFVIAAVGMAAIPATLVATTVGHLTTHVAFLVIACAAVLVLVAAFAAQSVDPLRG